jgi:predicted acylesterase/phospholipase RssA
MHATLRAFDPTSSQAEIDALRDRLLAAWEHRRGRPRDAQYYTDQLTFEDCHQAGRELYVIATNAYNGQKTVFAYRPHAGDRPAEQAEDVAMYESPPWLNPPSAAEITAVQDALRNADPPINVTLDFRRFENRVYRGYDPDLYLPQMPLALAVRASISVPIIFEPLRITRRNDPAASRPTEDLFIDGGIDDNFSLSVAVDRHLGNAGHVLGIALGNLGARLSDKRAAESMFTILLKTTEYMGDTVQDLGGMAAELAGHRVTVIDALTGKMATITDTNLISELIAEGRDIAREFWGDRHDRAPYPAHAPMPFATAFPLSPEAIFLSPAARTIAPPDLPEAQRTELPVADVFKLEWGQLRFEWRIVYALLAVFAAGLAAVLWLISEGLVDGVRGRFELALGRLVGWLGLTGLMFVVTVIGSRLAALALWRGRDAG